MWTFVVTSSSSVSDSAAAVEAGAESNAQEGAQWPHNPSSVSIPFYREVLKKQAHCLYMIKSVNNLFKMANKLSIIECM